MHATPPGATEMFLDVRFPLGNEVFCRGLQSSTSTLSMSGIEVAGIALAVFPILVKGPGQMVEGIETIKHWRKYKRQLETYASRLETARVSFQDTLTQLLDDLIESDVHFELIIAEPSGPLWKDPVYEKRLRDRLDQSYKAYLTTSRNLANGVQRLRNKLGIDAIGSVSCS